jgi:hypothetical protein
MEWSYDYKNLPAIQTDAGGIAHEYNQSNRLKPDGYVTGSPDSD